MKMTLTSRHFLRPRNLAGLLVVIFIIGLILEMAGVTHLIREDSRPAPASGSTYTKGESPRDKLSEETNNSVTNRQNDKGLAYPSSEAASLIEPSGNFVSNHRPNLSNTPAPNTISSVCTTTPGAVCTIHFTQNGTVRSLEARTADKGGSAYWDWKIQDLGLTIGVWKITAVSTLSGQTKTTMDSIDLEVSE